MGTAVGADVGAAVGVTGIDVDGTAVGSGAAVTDCGDSVAAAAVGVGSSDGAGVSDGADVNAAVGASVGTPVGISVADDARSSVGRAFSLSNTTNPRATEDTSMMMTIMAISIYPLALSM